MLKKGGFVITGSEYISGEDEALRLLRYTVVVDRQSDEGVSEREIRVGLDGGVLAACCCAMHDATRCAADKEPDEGGNADGA